MDGAAGSPQGRRPIGNGFELDLAGEQLWQGHEPVALRPKSWLVLRHLCARPGELVPLEELLDVAWPGTAVTPSALTNVINELRRVLGDDAAAPAFIQTVFRRGYRWVAQPSVKPSAPSGPGPGPAPAGARPRLFVGRAAKLQRLVELWKGAATGRRSMVFVGGDAGIGKTSLLVELEASVDGDGLLVAHGAAIESQGPPEPLLPLFSAIDDVVACERKWIVPLLERCAPSWLAQMPWVAPAGARNLPATPGASSMLREGVALCEAMAAERPLLLVLEDLHIADEATLNLLGLLAERTSSARLLVVGTYRAAQAVAAQHPVAAVVQSLQRRGRATLLLLSPLPRSDIRDWLALRFSSEALAASLADTMEQRSEGNPLFLLALTSHSIERGLVCEENGAWQMMSTSDTMLRELPDDLRGVVDSQVDTLGPELAETLEVGAAAGLRFVAQDVGAGMDRPADVADVLCHRLARSRHFLRATGDVVRPDGTRTGEYEFVHSLYRQACYERLSPARRQLVHQRIARGMEKAYGSETRAVARQLAAHFEAADDIARSVDYLREAVASAAHRQERDETHARWEKARERLRLRPQNRERDLQEIQLLFARSATAGIDYDRFGSEFLEVCEEAERLALRAEDRPTLFRARLGVAMANFFAGRIEQVDLTAAQLLAMSEDDLPTFRAQALSSASLSLIVKGEFEQAAAFLAQAVELDPEPGIPVTLDARSWAAVLYAFTLSILGRLREADLWTERAVSFSDATANLPSQATVETQIIEMYLARRDPVRAAAHIRRVEAVQRQLLGEPLNRTRALASCLPDSKDAPPELDSKETAPIRRWTTWPSLLASAQRTSGRLDDALRTIDCAFRDAAESGAGFNLAELHRERGEVALSQSAHLGEAGAIELAEAQFREAVRIARHQHARLFELRATNALARMLARTGRAAEAIAGLREIVSAFEKEEGCDVDEARSLLAQLAATES